MLRQSKKKWAISLGLLSLVAVLLGSTVLPAAGQVSATTGQTLNLTNPQSESTVELGVRDFLSLILGESETISAVESDYLATLSATPLKYTNTVPARCVTADYDDGTLTVHAATYTYTTAGGVTLTWYPVENATAGRYALTLSTVAADGSRSGTLTGLEGVSDLRVTIPYACTATVPAAVADSYLNVTYDYANELFCELTDYESRLATYNAYQDYLQKLAAYNTAYAQWQDYLSKKDKYDKDLVKYNAYEQAMSEYRDKLAAFNSYETAKEEYDQKKAAYDAAKEAYNNSVTAYNQAVAQYNKDLAEIERASTILTVLESAFISAGGNHFYATLMGDTVAAVVDNKDELVNVGKCDPNDIDTADNATRTLRVLLTDYKAQRGVPARFAYYSEHYEEIKENIITLYGRLYSLYNNSNVKTTLINRGKLERYMEFVSQLYVLSTGLDDTVNRKDDWEIAGRYDPAWYDYRYWTYQELLVEDALMPADRNNADPAGISCPTTTPTEPQAPNAFTLTAPTEPTKVDRPIEPETVNKPTEPTFVQEPTAPTHQDDPGAKPIAPSYTALQQRLIAARRDGTLTRRATGQDKTVTLQATLQKSLQSSRVEFYDYDGQTILFSDDPLVGNAIAYGGSTPTRADTAKYSYSFVGWKDEDGQLVEDFGVASTEGSRFYASYSETVRSYTVTWSVEGVEQSIVLPYGSDPVFEGTPTKEENARYTYHFAGWRVSGEEDFSTRLDSVTGDVTYEAVFESILRSYTVTWILNDDVTESALWDYGTVPAPVGTPTRPTDDRYVYEFSGWDTTPAEVTGDVTYTAQFTAIPILPSSDASAEVQAPVLEDNVYTATVPVSGQQIDRLLALAEANDCTVSLLSADGNASIYLNEAAIADLLAAGGTNVQIYTDGASCFLLLTNAEGEAVSINAPLTLRVGGADEYTKVYVKNGNALEVLAFEYENGTVTVRMREGGKLLLRKEYAVTVTPPENGELSANVEIAVAGDVVTLTLTPADEYDLSGVQVVGLLTGKTYTVGEDMTFVMPDEPVTVSATFSRKTYTVTFIVNGEVISSVTYQSGDTLVLPDDPTKAPDGNKIYTFTGWSPVVVTTVTADATYTAQFRESIQSTNDEYIPPESKNRAYLLYIEVGVILAVLIATPIVTVRLVKRHRRKKRANAEQASDTDQ